MRHLVSNAWALFVGAGRTMTAGGSNLVKVMTRWTGSFRQSPGRRWFAVGVAVTLVLTLVMMGAYGLNVTRVRGSGLVTNLPPPLLSINQLTQANGLFSATSAQLTALSHLEDQAVQNTLTDHGLPSSDADAVSSWGRDDALAELWGLLRTAITAQTRTADQQAAVDWLSNVAYREGLQGGYYAGLEYVKWAGLGQNQYNTLVTTYNSDYLAGRDTSTDKHNLETFLSQTPLNYNSTDISSATGGYCVYQSPAPFQSEYKDNIYPGNNEPASCTQAGNFACLAGCIPPIPTSDQFEKWGEADANNNIVSNPSYTQTARNIALGLGLGGIAASVAVGVGLSFALAGVMAGTAFQAAVFPFASIPLYTFGTAGAYIVPEAGAVAASGVGAIVGAVILFIVGTTIHAIDLAGLIDTPAKVAGYVEGVVGNNYDPRSMLNDQNGAGELYSLFVDATLPPPPPPSDTTAAPFPETDCLGSFLDTSNYLHICLDPPPPPAANPQTDPVFVVTPNGGTTGAPQRTLNWYDKATKGSNTAYLHGTWFINAITTSDGTHLLVKDTDNVARPLVQSLRIEYTDWDGNEQAAFLLKTPSAGYQFVSIHQQSAGTALNPDTCVADKTCVKSDSLHYVDSSGNKFAARVIPAPVPTISQTLVINPIEGHQATLQATASSPINAALTYEWQIEDKPLPTGGSVTLCTDAQMRPIPCPPPPVSVSGNPATYTFPTSGSFAVTLKVTDPTGVYATTSFTVSVADVAPTLVSAPACTPLVPLIGCQVYAEPQGTQTTLGGTLAHVGAEDVETLDVNWGDNTARDSVTNVECLSLGCTFDIFHARFNVAAAYTSGGQYYLPYTATHTYANPGQYTVTVKATDQSGATATTTATETVLAATQTSLSSSVNPSVWGQLVTLTATISSAHAGSPSGTVAFKDGSSDITGCGAQPVDTTTETATCVTSALSVSGHSITAVYQGDVNFSGSASSSLTQTVNKATTTTTVSVTSPTQPTGGPAGIAVSVAGQSVTYTAKVTVQAPGAGTPTGTVTFSEGATTLCSVTLPSSGVVTCAKAYAAAGQHSITVKYSGDSNFSSSTASLTLYVDTGLSSYLQHGVYNLSNVNLSGGYFVEDNLSGASLSNGKFSSANFSYANLTGANLSDANFSGTNFTGANLSGANLSNANFKGATLTGVIWSNTICPDGTTSTHDGGTCVGHL